MRLSSVVVTGFALALGALPASAQNPPVVRRITPFPDGFGQFRLESAARAAIGITTSSGSTSRDTLGVLVSSVYAGSPAEKAGVEEGNRVAAINSVSLKLSAADVGDDQMAGIMSRRLIRELERLKPGDEVDLRVYANGQTKVLKLKTVESGELYRSRVISRWDDRASLGLDFAVTGSTRDTLGVFVMGVDESGPAAKAGIEEGNRIAAVNGVDVRARRGEEEDGMLRTVNVNRLEREIGKLKVGDVADLRVYSAGQYKNVKVTAARAADLPRRNKVLRIIGGDHGVWPQGDGHDAGDWMVDIDGARIGDNVRRAVELAMDGAGRGLESVGRVLDEIGQGLRTRVQW